MAWFRKEKKPKEPTEKQTTIPQGLWLKVDDCKEILYRKEVEANLNLCPKCGYHLRLTARERFDILFDDKSYKEFAEKIRSSDPLEFRDTKRYRDRLKVYEQRVGRGDAVLCAEGKLDGMHVVICALEYNFMGGSMGPVDAEKFTQPLDPAPAKKPPALILPSSRHAPLPQAPFTLLQTP